MVCLRNICINTLHKGENDDDDDEDDDDDDNNNNNNNNNNTMTVIIQSSTIYINRNLATCFGYIWPFSRVSRENFTSVSRSTVKVHITWLQYHGPINNRSILYASIKQLSNWVFTNYFFTTQHIRMHHTNIGKICNE